ncbi:MAG: hypothetical protein L0Y79_04265 [Chlorobi bacterium]|nr:hypothetical protein [Chlorobiota bacterium]MCI0716274.1 hypothetical protein [Chlorobiota bacterium]
MKVLQNFRAPALKQTLKQILKQTLKQKSQENPELGGDELTGLTVHLWA